MILIYMHEDNIDTKINQTRQNGKPVTGYNNKRNALIKYKKDVYIPFRANMTALSFTPATAIPASTAYPSSVFQQAADLINEYYRKASEFQKKHKITSQSKFLSSIIEEISCYLFKDIPQIVSGDYGIFNHSVCSGLMIEPGKTITPLTKDVDFCIGINTSMTLGTSSPVDIVVPIIAVEVKTYLDATMFGEIKSSAREIQGATPCAKIYVLAGYNSVKDTPLIVARNQPTPSEIFVLRKNEKSPIDATSLEIYWHEVCHAVQSASIPVKIVTPGKLLHT